MPQAEKASHSLLLEHGLFRIQRPWPPQDAQGQPVQPDFTLEVVRDPTGCNSGNRDGLSAAEEIIEADLAAVVMLTAFSQADTVARAAAAGVLGYLVKPFTASDLGPAVAVAVARRAQMQALAAEIGDLGQRVSARQTVEAAKARLQAVMGLTEAEAFALLRRQAMDERVTLAEVAARVLEAAGPA